jgi:hypothetical protein
MDAVKLIEIARDNYNKNQSPHTLRRFKALLHHVFLDANLRINNYIQEYLQNKISEIAVRQI